MTRELAILIGFGAVAGAILLRPGGAASAPPYQVAQFAPGVLARLETRTGRIDICGLDISSVAMMLEAQRKPDNLSDKAFAPLLSQLTQLDELSHCVRLAAGKGD